MTKLVTTKMLISISLIVALLSGCTNQGSNVVVYPADEDISFSIISFNTLFGGSSSNGSVSEIVAVIEASGADVVALQEHVVSGQSIAKELGWDLAVFGVDNAIVSRYNIVKKLSQGAVIEFNEGNQIAVFDLHLDPYPYGPYDLRDDPSLTAEDLISSAAESRGEEVASYINNAKSYVESGTPVFLVGDFNEPSHLDWTAEAVTAGIKTLAVEWPTSKAVVDAGYTDVYRSIYTDAVANTGYTWTPDPSENEVHDRIDFIYVNSDRVEINSVDLLGPDDDVTTIVVEPYSSDHRGVVAKFVLPLAP
jgi:endonuclease/exonuclease/phosphatase family metal-dependent hydrolase